MSERRNPPVKGRRPDFRIQALRKSDSAKGELGVGWQNPDGTISLYFNPFVTVPTGPGYAISAFPFDRPHGARAAANDSPWEPQAADLDLPE